jgi:hypothetical protein
MTNDKDPNVWHSGPPPFVGWWNASSIKHWGAMRWWDGEKWSVAVFANDKPETRDGELVKLSQHTAMNQNMIEWSWQWPENARRPRPVVTTVGIFPDDPSVEFWIRQLSGRDWVFDCVGGFCIAVPEHYARYPVLIYADGRLA